MSKIGIREIEISIKNSKSWLKIIFSVFFVCSVSPSNVHSTNILSLIMYMYFPLEYTLSRYCTKEVSLLFTNTTSIWVFKDRRSSGFVKMLIKLIKIVYILARALFHFFKNHTWVLTNHSQIDQIRIVNNFSRLGG